MQTVQLNYHEEKTGRYRAVFFRAAYYNVIRWPAEWKEVEVRANSMEEAWAAITYHWGHSALVAFVEEK